MLVEKINMKKLNYTEDLLRVIFSWIGIFFLVSGVLSFLGILKPAVNSGIQNPDMLGTVFSITGVLLCIISAALGIYTAKLDKLHLQLIENGTKLDAVNLQQWRRWRRYVKHIKKNIRWFRLYCILQQQMQCMR